MMMTLDLRPKDGKICKTMHHSNHLLCLYQHDGLDFSVTNYDYDSHIPGKERMKMMTILIPQLGVELLRNLE